MQLPASVIILCLTFVRPELKEYHICAIAWIFEVLSIATDSRRQWKLSVSRALLTRSPGSVSAPGLFIIHERQGLLTRHNNNPAAEKGVKFCLGTWDTGQHLTYLLPLHSDHIKAIGWWRVVGGGLCDISVSPRPNPLPLLPLWNLLGFVWTGGLRIRLGLGPDNNAFLSHQIAMWHRGTPRCVWVW